MKNFTRIVGIIALVAVIGFAFAACGGSSPSDDPNDDEDTTAYFNVSTRSTIGFFKKDLSDLGFVVPDIKENSTLYAAKLALTAEDIVFTPAGVVEMKDFVNDEYGAINYNLTDLDPDNETTVTVSIKNKNGIKFVKATGGKDQFDI